MKRLNFSLAALLLCGALTLSACGGDADLAEVTAEGSGAVGEVEGGSISDDMLPLESVTSAAPARGGSDEGGEEGGADEGETAGNSEPVNPAPPPTAETAPEATGEGS